MTRTRSFLTTLPRSWFPCHTSPPPPTPWKPLVRVARFCADPVASRLPGQSARKSAPLCRGLTRAVSTQIRSLLVGFFLQKGLSPLPLQTPFPGVGGGTAWLCLRVASPFALSNTPLCFGAFPCRRLHGSQCRNSSPHVAEPAGWLSALRLPYPVHGRDAADGSFFLPGFQDVTLLAPLVPESWSAPPPLTGLSPWLFFPL